MGGAHPSIETQQSAAYVFSTTHDPAFELPGTIISVHCCRFLPLVFACVELATPNYHTQILVICSPLYMLHHVATPHQFARVRRPGCHELSIGIHCFCSITQGAIRDALHELLNGGLLLATGTRGQLSHGGSGQMYLGRNKGALGCQLWGVCVTKDPARRCSRTLPYKHGTVIGLSHRDSIHLAHLGYTHQLLCCFPWVKTGLRILDRAVAHQHQNKYTPKNIQKYCSPLSTAQS